ncbi:hypothetical protein BD410DRAFT_472711 [Rickenella mellea]|uniref:HNH nuclease domain-containing protein n=1 Tax=Rickenella mellea TaxID=50990 RepID=A0A4Y7QHY8_9AGAM|nr:hypothetical protein BD410DRAFT_472711 [Rickenella mellea]
MKAAGSCLTVESSNEKTPNIDDMAAYIQPTVRQQKLLRQYLMRRGNDRCVVTGGVHPDSVFWNDPYFNGMEAPLEASHILPYSLHDCNENDPQKFADAAATWDMIKNWTSTDILAIARNDINDASNAMMLNKTDHDNFGNFRWWFEPQGEPNTYVVKSRRRSSIEGRTVRFKDHSNKGIPLPSPEYLAIHAAFAKVFHASGAGVYIDRVFRDAEDMGVLSSDGLSDISTLLNSFQFTQQAAVH